MSAYTPGPWTILAPKKTGGAYGDPGDRAIMAASKLQVAEVFERTADGSAEGLELPSDANARLIAAAPEMFALLKSARAMRAPAQSWLDDVFALVTRVESHI